MPVVDLEGSIATVTRQLEEDLHAQGAPCCNQATLWQYELQLAGRKRANTYKEVILAAFLQIHRVTIAAEVQFAQDLFAS